MNSKLSQIFILLLIETSAFLLVFLFLVAERTYSILATFLIILLSGYMVRRVHSVQEMIRNLFQQHNKVALVWGFLFLLPVLLRKNPYQIYILFYAGVFALLALGLNWQIGGTNIVNFATGASFATGAYTAALLAKHLGLSFWILLPFSGLAAGRLGVILGLPCMKTERYYLSLVTIAFTLIVYLLLINFSWTGGPDGIADIPFPKIGSFSFGSPIHLFELEIPFQANFYYLTLLLVLLTFIVAKRFHHSKIGLAWNAIRDDEIAAECQGIDITYYKIILTKDLNITFGGLRAVCDVNLEVKKGEIVGLIGPNGSGKTTFFNLISGIYRPDSGTVLFEGEDIVELKPFQIARRGMARTFQTNRLFRDLSVLDNVLIGMHQRQEANLFGVIFKYQKTKSEFSKAAEEAIDLLRFFSKDLYRDRYKLVTDLPHADRKRVEICRALASDPKLLLLDKPSAGMSPKETEDLMEDIRRIREKKERVSLIVIEHDMEVIEKTADRVVVFNYGWKIAEGPFLEISKNPQVVQAYLGEESEGASS